MAFKVEEIQPLFTGILTTAQKYVGDQYEKKSSGLIIDTRKLDGALNVYQWVLAVGPMVKDVKVGDIVKVNYSRYAMVNHIPGKIENNVEADEMSYSYSIPSVYLEGRGECLMLQNNDIEYVVTKYSGIDDGGLLQ